MTIDKIFYTVLIILSGCSSKENQTIIEGHWHCINSEQCPFETIDMTDSTGITDKFKIINAHRTEFSIKENDGNSETRVELQKQKLKVTYNGIDSYYIKSDLNKCILSDRYSGCMIDLSLTEAESVLSYEMSQSKYYSGDLFIGRLRKGFDKETDKLRKMYPDSVFVQVNDVLIGFKDIPLYVSEFRMSHHAPPVNINIHADKRINAEILGTIFSLINKEQVRWTVIHLVAKSKNGDIGLLKR